MARTRESFGSAIGAPTRRGTYQVTKRIMDIVGATTMLVVFAPLMLVIAVLVKLTSPGPVFFRQERVGQHGQLFTVLKFRSMDPRVSLTADEEVRFQKRFKLPQDPRVTRVGAFLRKSSLDELPQVLNVLRGEMSLVGPRPVVQHELASMFGRAAGTVSQVRPGITGLWQVSGRSNLSYQERVHLEISYAERANLWMDVSILLRTPWVVLLGRGAE